MTLSKLIERWDKFLNCCSYTPEQHFQVSDFLRWDFQTKNGNLNLNIITNLKFNDNGTPSPLQNSGTSESEEAKGWRQVQEKIGQNICRSPDR